MELAKILKSEKEILLWMWFRSILLNHNSTFNNKKTKKSTRERILNIIKNLKFIKFKRKKIIMITSTYFNFIEKGKEYKNYQDKPYYDLFPKDTQIYEYPDENYKYKLPKDLASSSLLFYIEFFCFFLTKLIYNFQTDNKSFFKKINKKVSLKEIKKAEVQIKLLRIGYRFFLKLLTPEVIFINCGCYGGKQGVLIEMAKELEIKTIEIQHGIISKGNFIYQMTRLEKMFLKKYIPDYYFSFGEYWNSQINIPSELRVMGNSHLNSYRNKDSLKDIDYLIISQWTITNELIKIALELRELEKDKKIHYRLHPNEVLTLQQKELLEKNNIVICNSNYSVYQVLKRAKNVIGVYSTVLIESIIFDTNIYIYENEISKKYIPEKIGVFFKEIKEILNKRTLDNKKLSNYYWDSNFEKNYTNFITKELKLQLK